MTVFFGWSWNWTEIIMIFKPTEYFICVTLAVASPSNYAHLVFCPSISRARNCFPHCFVGNFRRIVAIMYTLRRGGIETNERRAREHPTGGDLAQFRKNHDIRCFTNYLCYLGTQNLLNQLVYRWRDAKKLWSMYFCVCRTQEWAMNRTRWFANPFMSMLRVIIECSVTGSPFSVQFACVRESAKE